MNNISKFNNSTVTSDVVHDRMSNLPYVKLSRQAEISCIKKAKLSFYYDVDDDKKAEFLEYYMEMFPKFREKYENADVLTKQKLLDCAIEDSLSYRDAFLGNNYRLVFKMAKSYMHHAKLENLFQEGVIGMMKALEKFDFSKNVRFSTYATIWIRQAITRYLGREDVLGVPVYIKELLIKIDKLRSEYKAATGQELTDKKLAEELGVTLDYLNFLFCAEKCANIVSLNAPVVAGEDNDSELESFIPSNQPDVDDLGDSEIIKESFREIIEKSDLTFREKEILYRRFGFCDGRIYTLSELSEELGISRERVRQIQNKALARLKTNSKMIHYYSDILGSNKRNVKQKKR